MLFNIYIICDCVHNKETISFHFVGFGLQYKLTSAINKSEDRRELPTVPQPTHTIEWLARTSFRHRPVRLNVPQQRKHTVPQQRKHKVARRRCVQHSQLDSSFIVYWRSNSCQKSCMLYGDIGANGECFDNVYLLALWGNSQCSHGVCIDCTRQLWLLNSLMDITLVYRISVFISCILYIHTCI